MREKLPNQSDRRTKLILVGVLAAVALAILASLTLDPGLLTRTLSVEQQQLLGP